MSTDYLEKKCMPCDLCEGSGYFSIDDEEGTHYVPCEHCLGYQCFEIRDGILSIYYGECDEHCGHNRESLKENWIKM